VVTRPAFKNLSKCRVLKAGPVFLENFYYYLKDYVRIKPCLMLTWPEDILTVVGMKYLLGPVSVTAEMAWCPEPKKANFQKPLIDLGIKMQVREDESSVIAE
jgi:hypothetical protein